MDPWNLESPKHNGGEAKSLIFPGHLECVVVEGVAIAVAVEIAVGDECEGVVAAVVVVVGVVVVVVVVVAAVVVAAGHHVEQSLPALVCAVEWKYWRGLRGCVSRFPWHLPRGANE